MARQRTVGGSEGGKSQPVRIALAGTSMYRDGTINKDQRLINCFQESIKNELNDAKKSFVVKRAGTTSSVETEAGVARGLIYWNSKFYSVVGDSLYEDDTDIYTLATSTGSVGFEPYTSEGVQYLFLCDGTNGYSITTAGVVSQINVTYSAWTQNNNYAAGDKVVPTVAVS